MSHTVKLAAVAIVALFAAPALAAPSPISGTFQVRATVIKGCSIATQDLAFGTYDPSSTTALRPSATTISLTCTKNTSVTVAPLVSAKGGGAGQFKMQVGNSGDTLTYNLYQDNTYAAATDWTHSANKSSTSVSTPVSFSVYGSIPPGQDVAASATDYTDTVTVNVTFN